MLGAFYKLGSPLLHALPPETAHELSLRALEMGLFPRQREPDPATLSVNVWGLSFPNPIGIAAGFDKEGRVADAILAMGCGFAEIGTVTPKPQPGNPKPRVFRLPEDRAVINRLGFNSSGIKPVFQRLSQRARAGIVGVNIGSNKEQTDKAADYIAGMQAFWPVASYFTVNISSPNTPGLRDLQAPAALDELLGRLMKTRSRLAKGGRSVPVIVKIAPDVAEEDVEPICSRLMAHGVDGIAVANTTLRRAGLKNAKTGAEAGGLSGAPLFERSTIMLGRIYQITGGKLPLIGVGGVDSGAAALAKIEAGASLVQLYTALIFEGPDLITRIKAHLAASVAAAGVASVTDLVGRRAGEWAGRRASN